MLTCAKCESEYKHASSLSRHKKTCSGIKRSGKGRPNKQTTLSKATPPTSTSSSSSFEVELLKQLNELKNDIEKLKLENDLNQSRQEFKMFKKNIK